MVFKIIFLFLPLMIFGKEYYEEPWGRGSELLEKSSQEILFKKSVGTKLANGIISFYQKNISPANGPRSHFRPTSSRYMQLAILRYGFFKGFIMGCDRLMRENNDPWVYRTIHINGIDYKFDPAMERKENPSGFH